MFRVNCFVVFLATLSSVLSQNPDCALVVPANPLTATGLSTAYVLKAVNPALGPCTQDVQSTFVEAAIFDKDKNTISMYHPLVITSGTTPAKPIVVPTLPANSIVALWFGTNADTLTLVDKQGSLAAGKCVNGVANSIFGQFAACNADAFFTAVNAAINNGKLTVPTLGTAIDGKACPTTRAFFVVDQDQSDNLLTTYFITPDGKTAQVTAANNASLTSKKVIYNGSDNLVTILMDQAMGCTPWKVPNLADPGNDVAGLALNEILADFKQPPVAALIPASDPMVLVNNRPNLQKLNNYRLAVDQFAVTSFKQASTTTYCKNFARLAPNRLKANKNALKAVASPDPAAANLFVFLVDRFANTFGADGLACDRRLGVRTPAIMTYDTNNIMIEAVIEEVDVNATAIPEDDDMDGSYLLFPEEATSTSPAWVLQVAAGFVVLCLLLL
jgi:hypothetical protein